MANIYETIFFYIRPYYSKIVFLTILGIFTWAAYYAYLKWGQTKPKPYADIYQPTASKETTIYFFFADWCPHCKKAKPTWASFSKKYDGKVMDGSKIVCVPVDCTDAEKPETAQMISQFNITTYPTIKMVKDDITYEFDAKITEANLDEFVKIQGEQ
jgi:thiol-disulfide isomerase/thioredoxin